MSKTLHPIWSQKHKDYMQRALKSTVSVAEGAVRAGKTIDNIAVFARLIDAGVPDRIHLASGSTVANAKLNLGDSNGFGLEWIFRGRCRWSKYRDNDALIIKSKGRDYIVIFAGGGKADSFKKIRGNSYGMWLATEINLHHPDFIKEAFNRQLAAQVRRVYWDLNPSSPANYIYKDYIDRFPAVYGDRYTYEHFTIRDNATITPDRLAEIEAQYEPGSIWYNRDILGERCNAEGLIYPQFDTEKHTVDYSSIRKIEAKETAKRAPRDREEIEWYVSCDYGIQNATTFQLWRKVLYQNRWICAREYYYSGRAEHHQKTDAELVSDLTDFLAGIRPKQIIVDPSAASLIAALRKAGYTVRKAKNDVLSGISEVAQCLHSGIICYDRSCKGVIEEYGIYSWDPKACEKGQDAPIKAHDHGQDATRYLIHTLGILDKQSKQEIPKKDLLFL